MIIFFFVLFSKYIIKLLNANKYYFNYSVTSDSKANDVWESIQKTTRFIVAINEESLSLCVKSGTHFGGSRTVKGKNHSLIYMLDIIYVNLCNTKLFCLRSFYVIAVYNQALL